MKRFIEVEYVQSGQPRPHADSAMVARIKFACQYRTTGEIDVSDLNDELVMRFCRGQFSWKDDPEWSDAKLEYLKKIDKGVWEIKIVEPYTG